MCVCLAANHVFLLEPSMDPAILQQAVGRAHRMGQTRPVHVTRLIMHSTVEVGWRGPSPRPPPPPFSHPPPLPRLGGVSDTLPYSKCAHWHCTFCYACVTAGMLYQRYCMHPILKLPCLLQQAASIFTYLLSESMLQFLLPHGVRLTSYQSLPLF